VGIDEVTLGLDALLQWERLSRRCCGFGLSFQITEFQNIGYLLLERKLDFEAGKPRDGKLITPSHAAARGSSGELNEFSKRDEN
jgi:hypothetical protein